MRKCLKHPKHLPTRLLGSLLTITYRCLPNCRIAKAFKKTLLFAILDLLCQRSMVRNSAFFDYFQLEKMNELVGFPEYLLDDARLGVHYPMVRKSSEY